MWDDDSGSLHALLWQVIRQHFIRHHFLLGKIGLHRGQPHVLALLWERNGLTQKDIAEALGLRPPTVTMILRRMEKAGLLRREADTRDMRVVRVYLTEKGQSLRKSVEEINEMMERECFSGLTPEEKLLLRRFLIRIRDNLREINDAEESR